MLRGGCRWPFPPSSRTFNAGTTCAGLGNRCSPSRSAIHLQNHAGGAGRSPMAGVVRPLRSYTPHTGRTRQSVVYLIPLQSQSSCFLCLPPYCFFLRSVRLWLVGWWLVHQLVASELVVGDVVVSRRLKPCASSSAPSTRIERDKRHRYRTDDDSDGDDDDSAPQSDDDDSRGSAASSDPGSDLSGAAPFCYCLHPKASISFCSLTRKCASRVGLCASCAFVTPPPVVGALLQG